MLYWTHRNDIPKEKALPLLQLSGILAIRRHCMRIVSESQLRIATEYLRGDIPSLLSNIQLWVQSGAGSAAAEQREDIRRALDALEARLRSVSKLCALFRFDSLTGVTEIGFDGKLLTD